MCSPLQLQTFQQRCVPLSSTANLLDKWHILQMGCYNTGRLQIPESAFHMQDLALQITDAVQ